MCGIAGIVAPNASRHEAALRRMIAALRHRGPDGEGAELFAQCALGHTRLSVVDHQGGAQPMVAPDGQTAVVFNGEVYGYKELRAGLMPEYPFRTHSDTEVLLALYQRDRQLMLDRLPGMFAFALWDERRRELFCARDRFGEKPFFYAIGKDGAFVFASELKGILASRLVEPQVDPGSIAHYLQHLYVHPYRTIYRNVHVLPPAHLLVYRDRHVEVMRYWSPPPVERGIDPDEATGQFRYLLSRAVAKQLVADVPVGAFLSGGLDSSTIVALASREHGQCRTFSFGFGNVIDELPFARGIAERYATDHTELTDEEPDIADLLVRMGEVYDEPFGDSSNVPTFLLCRQARRSVTVALTGEGCDELLGGYSFWYRPLFEMEQAGERDIATRAMARVVGAVSRRVGLTAPLWAAQLNRGRLLRQQFASPGCLHDHQTTCFSAAEIQALVPGAPDVAREPDATVAGSLDEILRQDLVTYLPGDILVKADRASMAHGLELRAPFLDWELATFCVSLPQQLKITSRRDKVILRSAFEAAWTPAVRKRGKQGFGAPVAHWLERPSVRVLTGDVLRNRRSRLYDFVTPRAAAASMEGDRYRTWALLVLAIWMESLRQPAAVT